ncbi:flagellar hook-basal body protein [Moorella sp. Hama-1]|uniref:flagellar hook-basal body protein n=1 Tax=Moorella sp. Hama-1 TaxID=2138101 RepID=UPI000D650AA4|nr:flagellar hook-basal body protein [Moorella sp. Hama-1]BCV20835.1 flagellar basal body protein [Moorella sp. Hama-1]
MIGVLWRGAGGMRAQQVQVDSLANDIANVNTNGYKQARVNFADLVYRPVEEGGMPVDHPPAPARPPALGAGVKVASIDKDFSQGTLVQTGDPLNLAIQGDGFFVVVDQAGNRYLTRDGNFHRDDAGYVVNASGYYLLGSDGNPLSLPPEAENIAVTPDGTITGVINGASQDLGYLDLYAVTNPGGLEAAGDNLFRETAASGQVFYGMPGAPGAPIPGAPATAGTTGPLGTLRSGYLEAANVDLAATMTKMIVAQRAYELNSRSVRVADEMWGLANNLRR